MRRRIAFALAGALVAAVAVIVAISRPVASPQTSGCTAQNPEIQGFRTISPPRPAPAEAFFDQAGEARTFADWRGKGLVVNFWATWCVPCVKEMPQLDRLAGMVEKEGIHVLPLSADREGAPVVERFYRRNGYKNLPILIDKATAVARKMGVSALPTTVLIDREGREVGRLLGAAEWDSPALVDLVRRCVGDQAPRRAGTSGRGNGG